MKITKDNIINICKRIAEKTIELLKEPNYDKPGLYNGKAGTLLFLNQLYNISKDNSIRNMALKLMDEIFEDIEKKELKFDFSEGIAGIASAFTYISENDFINSGINNEITDNIDKYIFKSLNNSIKLENYDLLTGYLGTGLYFIEKPTTQYANIGINKIVDAIKAQATYSQDKKHIFFYDYMSAENEEELQINLGIAHGMPSIIIFLSKLIETGYPAIKIKTIIEKSISWVLLHQLKESDCLYPGLIPSNTKTRLSWCYGDLDIAIMLYHAGKSLKNTKWIKKSKEIAIYSSYRRNLQKLEIWDSCFCHGTSGIAHILGKLSDYHNSTALADAADYWYELTYDNAISKNLEKLKTYNPALNMSELDPSLLDGLSGIGLVLLSKYSSNSWDKFFLLS